MINTTSRLAAVPCAAHATEPHPGLRTTDPLHAANLLWLRINKALAVVQCIALQQPTGNSMEAAQTDALAGAAVDLLVLALADCTTLETCIH